MIKEYRLPEDNGIKLATQLYVGDFPNNDKDYILLDRRIVLMLDDIRKHFKEKPQILRLNDDRYPYHSKGLAVDFKFSKSIPILKVLKYLDDKYPLRSGIRTSIEKGVFGYIHFDLRNSRWRALSVYNKPHVTLTETFPELQLGVEGQIVEMLKNALRRFGYNDYNKSRYTKTTQANIAWFQRDNGLAETGICDKDTWNKIIELL